MRYPLRTSVALAPHNNWCEGCRVAGATRPPRWRLTFGSAAMLDRAYAMYFGYLQLCLSVERDAMISRDNRNFTFATTRVRHVRCRAE